MGKRLLVAFSGRTGSTAAVALEIGQTLSSLGYQVDLRPIRDDPALAGYDAVVIGSAVRMGAWLWEAIDYVQRHETVLAKLPVAIFAVHALNTGDDAVSRRYRAAYLDAVRAHLRPVAEGFFQGEIDPTRLSLFERLTLRAIPVPPKDTCALEKVRAWAQSLRV